MPVAIRNTKTDPNKTVTFNFGSDRVLSYVVGIADWSFTFGSSDHHVRTLSLSLASNQPDAHTVTTKVTAVLSDASGNNIKNSDSSVFVCCVALVNSADSNLTLAGANAIPNNGASAPIALPGSSLSIAAAFLSGFDLSFGGGSDHHVHSVLTAAGLTASGTQGQITAQAAMEDSSGHGASTASINGGLIAATPSETGLYAKSETNLQTSDPVDIEFGTKISDAAVLLQDVDVQFDGGDHHVKTLGGGASDWTVRSTSVTLANARAFMRDDSGHNEASGSSSVSLVVVAIP
jgi:hypothetical protein